MADVSLHLVSESDLVILQKIAQETFLEAFGAVNSPENIDLYLKEKLSLEQLKREFDNPESSFYLAQIAHTSIGYLKLNTGKAQNEDLPNALEIERIYLYAAYQGQNIGKILLDKAIALAQEKNFQCVWLGVWEENLKAIHFYKKHGFKTFDKHAFMLGKEKQMDLMMKLELN